MTILEDSSARADAETEVFTRLMQRQSHVYRNGQGLVNWGLVRHGPNEDPRDVQLIASLMGRIYTAPLHSQCDLAKELVIENPEVAMDMWYEAASTCHADVRSALESSGEVTTRSYPACFNTEPEDYMVNRRNEIFEAPQNERIEKVQQLLQEFQDEGNEVVFTACVKGDVETLEYLLDSGCEVQPKTDDWLLPLHAACHNGSLECAKELLQRGANINYLDKCGGTPLMRAAVNQQEDIVEWLLANGADTTIRETREGNYSAFEYGARNTKITRMLLDAGCSFTSTALASAASYGNEDAFKVILEAGGYPLKDAEQTTTDKKNLSPEKLKALLLPLSKSAESGSTSIIQCLLQHLMPIMTQGPQELRAALEAAISQAITNAVSFDHLEAARILIPLTSDFITENAKDCIDEALYTAAAHDARTCITMLIYEYAANVNYLSQKTLSSPTDQAVRYGDAETVQLLLNHNADIHQAYGKHANGPTALCSAVQQQREDVVRIFLQHGGPVEYLAPEINANTRRVFISAAMGYRWPVRLLTTMDPAWDVQGTFDRFLCLEYPDGFHYDIQMRRSDDLLKDDRELGHPDENEAPEADV